MNTTNDPTLLLALSTLGLACSMIVPRIFRQWPLWGRAAWRVLGLIVLTILVQRILGSPFDPQFHHTSAGGHAWEQFIEAGWWFMAARSAIGLARLLIVLEHRPRETQIVSDLVAGAIYVATILAVTDFVFSVSISGLLATSGVIAIVLGLALQSTLSDVFSGIAVGVERPYKAGDLIWVEGGIEGHVLQVNWRSTHIATGSDNIAIVPNSIIAKARLVNRSLPTPVRSESMEIKLDARIPPERCIATLGAATLACRLPLTIPAPKVLCSALQGDGITYTVSYSVPSSATVMSARSEMAAQIHRHLFHAGIPLAIAGVAAVPLVPPPKPSDMLERSDLFGAIAADDRNLLAEHMTEIRLDPEDTLIRENDMPDALYIVASGVVRITTGEGDDARLRYLMSPGESLGSIGLITGMPYLATATAVTAVRAYRLDKDALAAAMKARPELAVGLEALARRGKLALMNAEASHTETSMEKPEMFLARIRHFLGSLAATDEFGT
ncbi:mechanosensitive ion channel family protein [Acidisphaera sp. L21]|uniref:mechanosensitive ion channel family protein n=1 Tax=Acidisphaera sp. L21 TaxID=1641851 RepID=UPI00131E240D|nr:mechanosensitive ion channel family protein [Acidisphaera sp. L21]